jgi:hypothetical protein
MHTEYKPPGFTIRPKHLTWLLILITASFFAFAVIMMRSVPPRPKPLLLASVEIRVTAWAPPNAASQPERLYPCVVLRNGSQDEWRNVAVTLDKQFYFYSHEPLAPQQTLTVPLEHFITKGGNVTFRPSSQQVEKVIVFAQIPNGDRGILEQKVHYP